MVTAVCLHFPEFSSSDSPAYPSCLATSHTVFYSSEKHIHRRTTTSIHTLGRYIHLRKTNIEYYVIQFHVGLQCYKKNKFEEGDGGGLGKLLWKLRVRDCGCSLVVECRSHVRILSASEKTPRKQEFFCNLGFFKTQNGTWNVFFVPLPGVAVRRESVSAVIIHVPQKHVFDTCGLSL
ncbi:hypothetical protein I79_024256 [Cricetulus griseus]|uniref:Uncharacterized protein n=1 Tax=Cricetulus griseus TaxID=10029 RepID=G3IK63_CRIGR|nr:hypothetical protein I79_024256 [Cricetulus griseus]